MVYKTAFFRILNTGVAIAFSSLTSLTANAQFIPSQIQPSNTAAEALAQWPIGEPAMSLQESTLVFSQTNRIAVRVYDLGGMPQLNLYNKQTGITELRGVPATVERTDAETTYRHAGDQVIEITVTNSGEQSITLNGTPQQASETIFGTVVYRPRIALPPNAIINVSLIDVSLADAPAITLASAQTTSSGRQVPFAFELLYDEGQIDARNRYEVESRITVDGELQFTNTTSIPVITRGNPATDVQIQVDPV